MADFFKLVGDSRIPHIVAPAALDAFEALPVSSAAEVHGSRTRDYVDWIERPYWLASDQMKSIMHKYNRQIRLKHVALVDTEQGRQHPYWALQVPALRCLSPESEQYPNGTIKRLVLERERLQGQHLFAVEDMLAPCLIISLAAAESLLRRNLTGFVLTRVEQS
ncbi:hypothetical protein [Paenibacillus sp. MMS18-CY102]|uniref:hypothetical protein n=1 Tax=Paenibacillus sp. MMS18-CY102 TaxID=2682849 RepID=UPI00136656D4|nr:hypothetical protein [Paenibacillus sp. MMS18-CY102]MWC30008.1 hypothetical protein [Paenibacillus sp. MMS18-CY102]